MSDRYKTTPNMKREADAKEQLFQRAMGLMDSCAVGLEAFAKRELTHFLGEEVGSAVSAYVDAQIDIGEGLLKGAADAAHSLSQLNPLRFAYDPKGALHSWEGLSKLAEMAANPAAFQRKSRPIRREPSTWSRGLSITKTGPATAPSWVSDTTSSTWNGVVPGSGNEAGAKARRPALPPGPRMLPTWQGRSAATGACLTRQVNSQAPQGQWVKSAAQPMDSPRTSTRSAPISPRATLLLADARRLCHRRTRRAGAAVPPSPAEPAPTVSAPADPQSGPPATAPTTAAEAATPAPSGVHQSAPALAGPEPMPSAAAPAGPLPSYGAESSLHASIPSESPLADSGFTQPGISLQQMALRSRSLDGRKRSGHNAVRRRLASGRPRSRS